MLLFRAFLYLFRNSGGKTRALFLSIFLEKSDLQASEQVSFLGFVIRKGLPQFLQIFSISGLELSWVGAEVLLPGRQVHLHP
jgi:hypothetical protein